LVTKPDFYNEETRRNLFSTLSELISLNIVPIINTNDAVSPPPQVDEDLAGVGTKKVRITQLYLARHLHAPLLGSTAPKTAPHANASRELLA